MNKMIETENQEDIDDWIQAFQCVMKECPPNIWFLSIRGDTYLHIMVADRDACCYVHNDYLIGIEGTHIWKCGNWQTK